MNVRFLLFNILSVFALGAVVLTLSFGLSGCIPTEPEKEVCEAGFTNDPDGKCVPGCKASSDCRDGQECQQVVCAKAPCYGVCQDCAPDHTFDKDSGKCVPGCQGKDDCADGKFCQQVVCVTTPCYGMCTACPDNQFYDDDTGKCISGCLSNSNCSDGKVCEQVQCFTTPCHKQCLVKPNS